MVELTFCSVRNCKDFADADDLCRKHYMQHFCLADNCANKSIGRGLCWKHYRRVLRGYYKRAAYVCLIFHALPHWLLYLQDHPMPKLTFDDLEKPKKPRRVPKPPKNPNAKRCSVPECEDYALCRGVCHRHYEYMQYHGILPPKVVEPVDCAVAGCHGKRYAKNRCRKHYARLYRHSMVDLAEYRTAALVHFGPEAMLNQVTV